MGPEDANAEATTHVLLSAKSTGFLGFYVLLWGFLRISWVLLVSSKSYIPT